MIQIAMMIMIMIMIVIIVSVTKFSIMIDFPLAYLTRNRQAITWVSNYWYPKTCLHFCSIPVTRYLCHSHENYARFNGFLPIVISNRRASCSSNFEITCAISLSYTPLGPVSKGKNDYNNNDDNVNNNDNKIRLYWTN